MLNPSFSNFLSRWALPFFLVAMVLTPTLLSAQEQKKETQFQEQKKDFKKFEKVEVGKQTVKEGPSKEEKRIYALINKANELPLDSAARVFDYIEEALALCLKYTDKRGEAYAYTTLGAVHYSLKRYAVSLEYYQKALNIFRSVDEPAGLYHVTGYLGSVYDALEQYDLALEQYNRFLGEAEEKQDWPNVLVTRYSIARVYFAQDEHKKAEQEYKKILALESLHGTEAGRSDANGFLGLNYQAMGELEKAESALNNSYLIADSIGDVGRADNSLYRFNTINDSNASASGKLGRAQKKLAYSSSRGNKFGVQSSNLLIGNLYLEDDRAGEALPFLNRSIDLATELGELEAQEEAYKSLSLAYEKGGDYKQALENFRKSIAVNESLRKEEQQRLLAELKLNNQVSLREARISNLEEEMGLDKRRITLLEKEKNFQATLAQRQLLIIYSLGGSLLVVLLATFLFYRSSQQKRKANQLLALRSLRSQMNPHFIFNSLNSVNSFISQNDERSANKYLSEFSRLMRAVLENSKHDFVSLDSEVSILELYLNLEHFRFSDKFEYGFTVDDDLDQEQVQVPPMLIQPYIENAIWHGLRYKEEKGFLKVELQQKDGKLIVVVEDNGIGRKRSQELKTKNQKDKKSTGLRNTSERLDLINRLHGIGYKVEIEDMEKAGIPLGTRVVLELPLGTEKIKET